MENNRNAHTVEKIGGTSMSRTCEVMNNVLVGSRRESERYNRMFVVSAYGGITNLLLEHKHSGDAGVYALYCDGDTDWEWSEALTRAFEHMREINAGLFSDPHVRRSADLHIRERIEGVRSCMLDLHRLCSYGHFRMSEHLATIREMLAALGEAHSAYNTVALLNQEGVNARLVDLTGWRDPRALELDERIAQHLHGIDIARELPVITGYAQCHGGIMSTYDRGYSDITFSCVAAQTGAREAIIHKEYHLSSADPKVVGEKRVQPIGRTNYDVADQLSNLGMEAIHPGAAKRLRRAGIALRVKNTFEPGHAGTLIDEGYRSATPQVEIIAGRRDVLAIELFDQEMVDMRHDYQRTFLELLKRFRLKSVGGDINANSLTYYVEPSLKNARRVTTALEEAFPYASANVKKVAFVSAVGSDLNVPGLLSCCSGALAAAGINVVAISQPMRGVDMRFVVEEDDYEQTVCVLHEAVVASHIDAKLGEVA
ncbi:MAG: aspartate kinase [Gammaproteobacteria bacterium]